MPKLTIDNQEVTVPAGATVLDAARQLGIDIPTLCHMPGMPPATSCMVCVVKVNDNPRLAPSCALKAEEGMRIRSQCDEVLEARRAALELLLAEHVGDCMGPCQIICPAGMNIPLMIRQIRAGRLEDAIVTVKRHIALPAVLGRVCHAPCEKGCRRAQADAAVSICLLKRFVADTDLARQQPYLPARQAATGKKVAIVGAGPAGAAAAWRLLQDGHAVTVFDEQDRPGGMLHKIDAGQLPPDVVQAEMDLIARLGAQFRLGCRVGTEPTLDDLRRDYDAVLLAVGEVSPSAADLADKAGLTPPQGKPAVRLAVDRKTFQTSLAGIFAAGGATRAGKHAVLAVADGQAAACSIAQFLAGKDVTGPVKPFNVSLGKLLEGEINSFLSSADPAARAETQPYQPLSPAQAHDESARCLHCDCRKSDTCRLRQFSSQYGAKPTRYRNHRLAFCQRSDHPRLVYESGKCIACGICIRIVEQAGQQPGLCFTGRGFGVTVSVPFDGTIEEAVGDLADQLVSACPTAAWAYKD